MNRTNRNLVAAMAIAATLYLLMSWFYSALRIWDTGAYEFCAFDLFGPLLNADPAAWYLDLAAQLPAGIRDAFAGVLSTLYWDPLAQLGDAVDARLWKLLFGFLGAALALAGMTAKRGMRAPGDADDPQEFLITHRHLAWPQALLLPWNIFPAAWSYHYVPIVIPILLLPFIIPYALMADVVVVIVFAVEQLVIRLRIRSAAKKDDETYREKVGFAVCPQCRAQFVRPRVVCAVCGLEMNYPVPGPHGIKYHTCNKGHRIPCTNKDGIRGRLDAVCPRCGSRIATHEARPLVFGLIGAEGAGKTSLMLAAAENICDSATRRSVTTEAATPGISKQVQAARANIAPTRPGELPSECLFIRSRDLDERELVINDISGQEFEADENRNYFEEYYHYCCGLVFVIDPLDVAAVFNSKSLTKGSKTTPMSVFDSFFQVFSTINGTGPAHVSDVPLAVVLTKNANPAAAAALHGRAPEAFLRDSGQAQFVDTVAASFSRVRYFTADSLKDDDTAAAPFLWILGLVDAELVHQLAEPSSSGAKQE